MRASPGSRLCIVVAGMVAGNPGQGGASWAVLQYVLGLRRLGHEVFLVEPVEQEQVGDGDLESSHAAAYFRDLVRDFDLEGHAALHRSGTPETVGLTYSELAQVCAGADLLLDISGLLAREPLAAGIPRRAYVDLDPAFTQLWQQLEGIDMGFGGHTHFVTVGLAVGDPECPVPTCGREWIPTCPPVVLERWPVARELVHDALTTVTNWRGYGSIKKNGVLYGQKVHSLRELIELPTLTDTPIEIAVDIHPNEVPDLEALARNRWALLDPSWVAGTPGRYQQFVQGSRAELGIAKSGYVHSRCGWFSDRSACYLASGRPVIAQDTGFGRYLPSAEGLIAFATVDEALAAVDELGRDYERHRRAARAFAEEYLDSDRVLSVLLDRLGAS